MIKKQNGFSMVEILVAMVMFLMVIIAATNIFQSVLTTSKQQSKIVETNIEGIVGLDILRRDIEHAGYGLPWNMGGATYSEADNTKTITNLTTQNDEFFNDASSAAPRALVSGDGIGEDGSDVLVIKSMIVGANNASQKWTHVKKNNQVYEWVPVKEILDDDDRVVVLIPGDVRTLKVSGTAYSARYDYRTDPAIDRLLSADGTPMAAGTALLPVDDNKTYIVYGVTGKVTGAEATPLRMPFNRADYYVRRPIVNTDPLWPMPSRCALGTGILVKGIVNHADGDLNELPVIDCVADMQVVYGVDTDNDGNYDPASGDTIMSDLSLLSPYNAESVRRVKQVMVFILAHEGQKDPNFTYTTDPVTVGGLGRNYSLSSNITDWQNYRWKVYTLVVKVEG